MWFSWLVSPRDLYATYIFLHSAGSIAATQRTVAECANQLIVLSFPISGPRTPQDKINISGCETFCLFAIQNYIFFKSEIILEVFIFIHLSPIGIWGYNRC